MRRHPERGQVVKVSTLCKEGSSGQKGRAFSLSPSGLATKGSADFHPLNVLCMHATPLRSKALGSTGSCPGDQTR